MTTTTTAPYRGAGPGNQRLVIRTRGVVRLRSSFVDGKVTLSDIDTSQASSSVDFGGRTVDLGRLTIPSGPYTYTCEPNKLVFRDEAGIVSTGTRI